MYSEISMKLGLLTACLPDLNLEQIATFAADTGLESLEIAAWPRTGNRPFTASHLDVTTMTEREAHATLAMLATKNLAISGVAYYDNNLHPDPTEREAVNAHVIACIDAAVLLGCSVVGTFVGRDPMKTVSENLREAEQLFPHLVEYGGERGVRLAIENCPGGLAPRRLPRKLGLLARTLGMDVLSWPLPQLRPLPSLLAGHGPRGGGTSVRQPGRACTGEGPRVVS